MRARIPRAVWGGTPIAPPPCVRLASAACIATIGALALRASAAAAQTPLDMPEQPPETPPIAATPPAPAEMRWYGWQTLVADAGAVGLFGLAAFAGGDRDSTAAVAVGLIGLSTYLAGGPIIHAAQQQGQLPTPSNVVMFDAHHDALEPACLDCIRQVRTDGFTTEDVIELGREGLRTLDDDW